MIKISSILTTALVFLSACSHTPARAPMNPKLHFEGEKNLANLRALTSGGSNAEATFSGDGERLVFQRQGSGESCEQIYTMKTDGSELKRVSDGKGRATCALFIPGHDRILYSRQPNCPTPPEADLGYVRPVDSDLQTMTIKSDGSDPLPLEAAAPRAYQSETATCKDGTVVFTSDRDGDLELYRGRLDKGGTLGEIKRLTQALGYDGGARFSPDCKRIVWIASRPQPGTETDDYRQLLKRHLFRPSRLELWTADADGAHVRQLTRLGAVSFAPTFTPNGQHVLFSANLREKSKFDLYKIRVDGTRLERVTFADGFNSFPAFSPDGHTLAFSSTRLAAPGAPQILLANWGETPEREITDRDENTADRLVATATRLLLPETEAYVAERMKALGLLPYGAESYLHSAGEQKKPTTNTLVGAWSMGERGCQGGSTLLIGAHESASGVATMLETARLLIAAKRPGCFVFAALKGNNADFLMNRKNHFKAMILLDGVGHLESSRLMVHGTDSATEWAAIVSETCARGGLTCPTTGEGNKPSDLTAFYQKGTPVLQLFTDPQSDGQNGTGMAQIAEIAAELAARSVLKRQPLHYRKAVAVPTMAKITPAPEKNTDPSSRPYLGTIPDYASLTSNHGTVSAGADPGGVKLSGVREGSPAERAGVQSGDLLTAIETHRAPAAGAEAVQIRTIVTFEDFMSVLSGLQVNEDIVLHIKRNGASIKLPIKVGKRE